MRVDRLVDSALLRAGRWLWPGAAPRARSPRPALLVTDCVRLVGTARFELATPCTPSKCATRLRYVPMESAAKADNVGLTFKFYTRQPHTATNFPLTVVIPRGFHVVCGVWEFQLFLRGLGSAFCCSFPLRCSMQHQVSPGAHLRISRSNKS